jgi:hypothetical protein
MEVGKLYLLSGQPMQGKTTIANQFDLPVISLDEVFLIWYNELTHIDNRYHFSVPNAFLSLPQSHINCLLDRICTEINTLIESGQTEIVIDGWLLFFYKECIKKKYTELKIIDIVIHGHYCYIDGIVYKNIFESEINKNIIEPIKLL